MERMATRLERALNPLLALAAVVAAATALHREFFPKPVSAAPPMGGPPVAESRWEEAQAHGVRVGPSNARVTIVEFADFECPACKGFHSDLRRVLTKYPQDVAFLLVNFPLPGHTNANAAAKAGLCAESAGRFGAFSDALFAQQDSLGTKTWSAFALQAGIDDLDSFQRCLADESVQRRVDASRSLGVSMQIAGTPTVIINGWRYSYPPRGDELESAVVNALRGKRPHGAD